MKITVTFKNLIAGITLAAASVGVSAQSVTTTEGPKQYGTVDTSTCVAPSVSAGMACDITRFFDTNTEEGIRQTIEYSNTQGSCAPVGSRCSNSVISGAPGQQNNLRICSARPVACVMTYFDYNTEQGVYSTIDYQAPGYTCARRNASTSSCPAGTIKRDFEFRFTYTTVCEVPEPVGPRSGDSLCTYLKDSGQRSACGDGDVPPAWYLASNSSGRCTAPLFPRDSEGSEMVCYENVIICPSGSTLQATSTQAQCIQN